MVIEFRPATASDEPFLYSLFVATQAGALALEAWDPLQAESLLRMQFRAQRLGFLQQAPCAVDYLVVSDGLPVGRLLVDRGDHETRILDLALLPAHQGAGIGTQLLQTFQAEAAQAGHHLLLSVLSTNRAQDLYRRLGFVDIGETGPHLHMRWPAE